MNNLSIQEQKFITSLREKLQDKALVKSIAVASYLISEIEYQYGADVAEFIVGYQSGLMQSGCKESDDGKTPILAMAGNYASEAFSRIQDEINEVMCEIYDETYIDTSSNEAKELSKAVLAFESSIGA